MNETNRKIAEGVGLRPRAFLTGYYYSELRDGTRYLKPIPNYTESRDLAANAVIEWCGDNHERWKTYAEKLWNKLDGNADGHAYMRMIGQASVALAEVTAQALAEAMKEERDG